MNMTVSRHSAIYCRAQRLGWPVLTTGLRNEYIIGDLESANFSKFQHHGVLNPFTNRFQKRDTGFGLTAQMSDAASSAPIYTSDFIYFWALHRSLATNAAPRTPCAEGAQFFWAMLFGTCAQNAHMCIVSSISKWKF